MQQYILMFRNTPSKLLEAQGSPSIQKQWEEWLNDIAGSGAMTSGARPAADGAVVNAAGIIAGPFLEGGKVFSGLIVMKASSIDEAIERAKNCPIVAAGGSVEVRKLME